MRLEAVYVMCTAVSRQIVPFTHWRGGQLRKSTNDGAETGGQFLPHRAASSAAGVASKAAQSDSRMQTLNALAAGCVQSRQFFASTLREQLRIKKLRHH